MATLEMPRLAGGRARATEMASILPEDLSGTVIVVDAGHMEAASQSFADELCKQILQVRGAIQLEVRSTTATFAQYLHNSARLRCTSDRLFVDIRPDS